MSALDCNPLVNVVIHALGIAERAGGRPQVTKRNAGDVAFRLRRVYTAKCCYRGLIRSKTLVSLVGHPCRNDLLEWHVVHEPDKDFLVLVHAIDEESFEDILEKQLKLVPGIH